MIRRVKLVNVRSHVNTEVTFEEGVNVLVGPNGAGKTTILDAVLMALFPPRGRRGRLKRENVIRRGENRAKVELDFVAPDGNVYRVEREFGKEGQIAVLRVKEGEVWRPVAQGAENVTEAIADVLGVDAPLFENAVYVKQGEIQAVVDARPSERKELIDAILGTKEFDKARDRAHEVLKIVESRVQLLENELKRRRVELKELEREVSEAPDVKRALEAVEEEMEKLDSEIETLERDFERWRELSRDVEELEARLREEEAELKELESELEEALKAEKRLEELDRERLEEERDRIEEELNVLDEIIPLLSSYEEAVERLSRLKTRIRDLHERREEIVGRVPGAPKDLDELEEVCLELERVLRALPGDVPRAEELERVEERLKSVSSELESVEDELDEIHERLSEVNERIGMLKSRERELKERLDALRKAGSRCPVCGRELDDETRAELIEETERELEEVRRSLEELEAERDRLLERRDSLKLKEASLRDEKDRLESEARALRRDLEEAERTAATLARLLSSLGVEAPEDPEAIAKVADDVLRSLRRLSTLLEKIQEVERDLAEVERVVERRTDELRKKGFDPESSSVEDLRARRRELQERLKSLLEDLRSVERLEERASRIESLRDKINRRKANITSLKEELNRLKSELSLFEKKYEEGLEGLRKKLKERQRERDLLGEKKGELRQKLTELERKKERISELKEEVKQREKELDALRTLELYLRACKDVFSVAKEVRREVALPRVEDVASRLLSEMSDALGGEVRLEDGGERLLVRGPSGEWMDASALSGGEKVLVGLALRLGLASVGSGFASFVMLDEPTVHLDEEHRGRLAEALRSLRVGVDQAIVVTHDPELEDAADVLFRVRKTGNVSEVERVEATEIGSG